MSDRFAAAAEIGLQFFGKVTASLSHEMRNVLATIYENAGLLEDLVLCTEKGRPLDPNRIQDLAGRLKAQVRRGRGIADNMNRLAHSVDEPMASIDLREIADFVTSVGQRIASMRGVTLLAERAENPVVIRTTPFVLDNLIWLCLELGMCAGLAGKTLTVIPDLGEKGPRVRIKGLQGLRGLTGDASLTRKLGVLAGVAGAELNVDEERGEIVLSLPQDVNGRSQNACRF